VASEPPSAVLFTTYSKANFTGFSPQRQQRRVSLNDSAI
jgi:hypothetical protein